MFGIDDLIIGGVISGAVGLFSRHKAKETNEEARMTIQQAKQRYDIEQANLNSYINATQNSMRKYGAYKKFVMDTAIRQFCYSFSKIHKLELLENDQLYDWRTFQMIKPQEIYQLNQVGLKYDDQLKTAAEGGATGALIALAASGGTEAIAALATTTGSAILAGDMVAAGSALAEAGGTALGVLADTPLIAFAGPALLFSGLSANSKANENLSNAWAYESKVNAAVQKMKTQESTLDFVNGWTCAFENQLRAVNKLFVASTNLLTNLVINKSRGFLGIKRKVSIDDFNEEEREIIRVTAVLAKYVKTIIDTPMLDASTGSVRAESRSTYNEYQNQLPRLEGRLQETREKIFDQQIISESNQLATTQANINTDNIDEINRIVESVEANCEESSSVNNIIILLLIVIAVIFCFFGPTIKDTISDIQKNEAVNQSTKSEQNSDIEKPAMKNNTVDASTDSLSSTALGILGDFNRNVSYWRKEISDFLAEYSVATASTGSNKHKPDKPEIIIPIRNGELYAPELDVVKEAPPLQKFINRSGFQKITDNRCGFTFIVPAEDVAEIIRKEENPVTSIPIFSITVDKGLVNYTVCADKHGAGKLKGEAALKYAVAFRTQRLKAIVWARTFNSKFKQDFGDGWYLLSARNQSRQLLVEKGYVGKKYIQYISVIVDENKYQGNSEELADYLINSFTPGPII